MTDSGARGRDFHGLEWDFLALDGDGSIALLSSAGSGQIPQQVLNEAAAVDAAVVALRGLAPLGESTDLRPQGGFGDYSEWFELSRRGVYSYDWRLNLGPYQRISAPTAVLNVVAAEPVIAKAAALLRLPLLFAQTAELRLGEPVS